MGEEEEEEEAIIIFSFLVFLWHKEYILFLFHLFVLFIEALRSISIVAFVNKPFLFLFIETHNKLKQLDQFLTLP